VCSANKTYRNHFCGHRDESRTVGYSTFGGGGEDQISCYHVDDYWKCIMINDMKQANRRTCFDEEWSDEKGLSGTLMPYSLMYYKRTFFLIFGSCPTRMGTI